jgi:hypothetical protein
MAALLTLAGCGTDEDDPYAVPEEFRAYCEEVEAQQAAIGEALASGPTTGLIEALPSFRALAAEAPRDVADAWDTLITRTDALADALDAAGVDPATYDRADPPAGLTREQRRAIDAAATALAAPATAAATAEVEQHARDVCKSPLSL